MRSTDFLWSCYGLFRSWCMDHFPSWLIYIFASWSLVYFRVVSAIMFTSVVNGVLLTSLENGILFQPWSDGSHTSFVITVVPVGSVALLVKLVIGAFTNDLISMLIAEFFTRQITREIN